MDTLKRLIDWGFAHPGAVAAAAIAIYPVVDGIIRLVIPAAKVVEWETKGGAILKAAAKAYRALEKILATNR